MEYSKEELISLYEDEYQKSAGRRLKDDEDDRIYGSVFVSAILKMNPKERVDLIVSLGDNCYHFVSDRILNYTDLETPTSCYHPDFYKEFVKPIIHRIESGAHLYLKGENSFSHRGDFYIIFKTILINRKYHLLNDIYWDDFQNSYILNEDWLTDEMFEEIAKLKIRTFHWELYIMYYFRHRFPFETGVETGSWSSGVEKIKRRYDILVKYDHIKRAIL